jgi:hypothetical protein
MWLRIERHSIIVFNHFQTNILCRCKWSLEAMHLKNVNFHTVRRIGKLNFEVIDLPEIKCQNWKFFCCLTVWALGLSIRCKAVMRLVIVKSCNHVKIVTTRLNQSMSESSPPIDINLNLSSWQQHGSLATLYCETIRRANILNSFRFSPFLLL